MDKVENLPATLEEWLAQPGPALLNVKVEPMELVIPRFTALGPTYGMAMYSIKAVLQGKAGDVLEMIGEDFICAGTKRWRGADEPNTHLPRLRHRAIPLHRGDVALGREDGKFSERDFQWQLWGFEGIFGDQIVF